MKVDQQWVKDNFDIVDKIFSRLNKGEASSNLARNRKEMKEDMDKLKFRGYYELARKQEKDKVNKSKTIGDKQERIRMDEITEANASNTKYAIDVLEEQADETNKIIKVMGNQLTQKDKQISEYMKQIEILLKTIQSISQK